MNQDRTWTLIARKLTGEALPGELDELKCLLTEDKMLEEKLKMISEFWDARDPGPRTIIDKAYEDLWQKINYDQ